MGHAICFRSDWFREASQFNVNPTSTLMIPSLNRSNNIMVYC